MSLECLKEMLYKFNGHYNVDTNNKRVVKLNRQNAAFCYDFNFLRFSVLVSIIDEDLFPSISYDVQL